MSPDEAVPDQPGELTEPSEPRSLRRSFAALVLVGEIFVVGFASLVAKDLSDVSGGTLALVAGGTALLCVVAAGTLRWRFGFALGWLVQLLLVLSGFWVPMMFFVGAMFAVIWFVALQQGGRADVITAQRQVLEQQDRQDHEQSNDG